MRPDRCEVWAGVSYLSPGGVGADRVSSKDSTQGVGA